MCAFAFRALPALLLSSTLAAAQALAQPPKPAAIELMRVEARGLSFCGFSPDSKAIAYIGTVYLEKGKKRQELILVDLAAGKELKRGEVETGKWVQGGVFSPDGKLLALEVATYGRDRPLPKPILWDVAGWKPLRTLELPEGHRFAKPLAFSPDGKWVAGATAAKSDGELFDSVVIWDVARDKCRRLEWPKDLKLEVMGWSPMGWNRFARSSRPEKLRFRVTEALFAEGGEPYLLTWNRGGTDVWGLARGQPILWTEWDGNARSVRLTPGGHVALLPRYREPLLAVFPSNKDGTVVVEAVPWGRFGKHQKLTRLDAFKFQKRTGNNAPRCFLSPDGNKLALHGIDPPTAGTDRMTWILIVWDVSALHQAAAKMPEQRILKDLERYWATLFGSDLPSTAELALAAKLLLPGVPLDMERQKRQSAAARYNDCLWALQSLAAHPEPGVQFLRARLRPAPDLRKVPRLIEDLDAKKFATRERAQQELERFGPPIRTLLKAALKKDASLEMRTRIKRLLNKLEEKETERNYECRMAWIIDLLAHLETPEARKLLQAFAEGKYDPAFADQAKKALRRSREKP